MWTRGPLSVVTAVCSLFMLGVYTYTWYVIYINICIHIYIRHTKIRVHVSAQTRIHARVRSRSWPLHAGPRRRRFMERKTSRRTRPIQKPTNGVPQRGVTNVNIIVYPCAPSLHDSRRSVEIPSFSVLRGSNRPNGPWSVARPRSRRGLFRYSNRRPTIAGKTGVREIPAFRRASWPPAVNSAVFIESRRLAVAGLRRSARAGPARPRHSETECPDTALEIFGTSIICCFRSILRGVWVDRISDICSRPLARVYLRIRSPGVWKWRVTDR